MEHRSLHQAAVAVYSFMAFPFGIRRTLHRFLTYIQDCGGAFDGHYREWRVRRVAAILRHYGPSFFHGKTMVELGAGYADIGAAFARLGAEVLAVDGRAENVEMIRRRHPALKTELANLDGKWPWSKPFDIVLHLGLLYHLEKAEESLRLACQNCTYLILETEVADSTDPMFILHPQEGAEIYDQSLSGTGSRPSPAYVERILTECGMSFERVESADLDTVHVREGFTDHLYSWPVGNSGKYAHGWRKFWFAKRT